MNSVLVIDFGGQYSQLIARRVRELRVFSELIPYDTDIETIKAKKPKGLIFSGSPYSINSKKNKVPSVDKKFFSLVYQYWEYATVCSSWQNLQAVK